MRPQRLRSGTFSSPFQFFLRFENSQLQAVVCVVFCLTFTAGPVTGVPVHKRDYRDVFTSTPVVHAAPAFDSPTAAPIRTGQEVSGNEIDSAGSYSFEYAVQAQDGGHSRQESRDPDGTVRGESFGIVSGERFQGSTLANTSFHRTVHNKLSRRSSENRGLHS